MTKNILVTGANGFTGSHLVDRLKRKHNIVSLIHTSIKGDWQANALKESIKWAGDIRDPLGLQELIAHQEIDEIYHTAALAKVKTAYLEPYSVFDVNVMGTVALLEAARQLDVDRILLMQTDKVYGEGLNLNEDAGYETSEPYATSKCCQGFIAATYAETYGMNIVLPHCCNIFGYDPYSNRIVPNVIKDCLQGKSPAIYSNDNSIREYIFIEDLLDGFEVLMKDKSMMGAYNFSTGWVYNQKDIVLKILNNFPDLEPQIIEADLPMQIEEESLSSCRWDWKPQFDIDSALAVTIERFESFRKDWLK